MLPRTNVKRRAWNKRNLQELNPCLKRIGGTKYPEQESHLKEQNREGIIPIFALMGLFMRTVSVSKLGKGTPALTRYAPRSVTMRGGSLGNCRVLNDDYMSFNNV